MDPELLYVIITGCLLLGAGMGAFLALVFTETLISEAWALLTVLFFMVLILALCLFIGNIGYGFYQSL